MKLIKGQSFLPDFMASFMVFSVVLVFFFFAWNSIMDAQTEFSDEERMRETAYRTTAFLVSTPGYPSDWEDSGDVRIPGFAEPDHLLQYEKLQAFDSLTYDEQKRLLKASDFYLSINNETSVIQHGGDRLEYGHDYSSADTVVPMTRSVRINLSGKTQVAEMRYVVWR